MERPTRVAPNSRIRSTTTRCLARLRSRNFTSRLSEALRNDSGSSTREGFWTASNLICSLVAPCHYILIDLATLAKALHRRQPGNGVPRGTDPHENENGARFDLLKSKIVGMVDGQRDVPSMARGCDRSTDVNIW
jgi:hypothetical protein